MSFVNIFSEKVTMPLGDQISGRDISSKLFFLDKSQWWPKDRIEHYQNDRLKKLIIHAYDSVPYYRRMFDERNLNPTDISCKEDLKKLPILTKKLIKENFPDSIVSNTINSYNMVNNSSSGSTGEPLKYFETKESYSLNKALNLRHWYWIGYRLGDRYTKLNVNPMKSWSKKIQNLLFNCYYISTSHLSDAQIGNIVDYWRIRKDKIIRGNPSALYVFAQYILKTGINDLSPLAVTTTGEILFPHFRSKIESAFNCKVFDSYCGEGGSLVSQCPKSSYHLSSEYAITEFIDEEGDNVKSGKASVVSTDLWNYAVPFIRYEVGDTVTLNESKCRCNRVNCGKIQTIDGRHGDVILTPSGKLITLPFFAGFFKNYEMISKFQIIQNKEGTIEVLIVPEENFDINELFHIKKSINDYLRDELSLHLQVVDDIPLEKSGKRKFLINNMEPKK